MPTLVLKDHISPARTSAVSSLRRILAKVHPSLEGVLIFSGIGFALTMLGIVFQVLELPPPYF